MSSRGRGFSSRGGSSYRGRGGGGDWSGGSSNSIGSRGGGGYSASRGRFNYSTPSYDSRSKYTSGGGSDRYSSRGGRGDNSNSYKRSSRDSYSGRDDHRSSSESTRKRLRNDSYQGGGSGGGSSQRYSSTYGGSSSAPPYDDNKRSSSSSVYDDNNKRQSERTSTYHRSEDRHSASRGYAPPPPSRKTQMPPPSAPRYSTPSRGRISHQTGGYRGRISTRGGRGFHRISSRSDVILARKRNLQSLDYRRKLMASRSRDYIQRVRMTSTKLRRSSGTTRVSGGKKDSSVASSVKDKDREMAKAINAAFSDDDDDEDDKSAWDDDEKNLEHDEDEEEEAEEKKKKDEKRKKEKQERERQNSDDEEEKEDEEKEEDDEEKPEQEEQDEAEDEDGDEEPKEERGVATDEPIRRADGRRFIKLNCPHCAHRSVTFKEYSLHLYSGRHNAAMRRVAARHKATLARMRVLQRQEQRRVEARDLQRGTLPSRTMFCPVCKLNYRSLKAVHQLSDSHRQMKRFLTPFCRVCRIQFRSPMLYESHVCTLDHIKRKSVLADRIGNGGVDGAEGEAESSGPDDDDKEVNLDNFMTLDSVGDVDAEENEETADKKKKEKPEGDAAMVVDGEKKAKNKQMIKVGAEYIKRVEVQFCELCKVYLPRSDNGEQAVALHCSTRSHLKRYVRDNDDKALRRHAERIHLQSSSSVNVSLTSNTSASGESIKAGPTDDPASTLTGTTTAPANNTLNTEGGVKAEHRGPTETDKTVKLVEKDATGEEEDDDDYQGDSTDKIWDDVDKDDLGNILQEVEPGAKSSDDEDSRYDKFRNSEKKLHKEKEAERGGAGAEGGDKETDEKDGTTKKSDGKIKQSEKTEK